MPVGEPSSYSKKAPGKASGGVFGLSTIIRLEAPDNTNYFALDTNSGGVYRAH